MLALPSVYVQRRPAHLAWAYRYSRTVHIARTISSRVERTLKTNDHLISCEFFFGTKIRTVVLDLYELWLIRTDVSPGDRSRTEPIFCRRHHRPIIGATSLFSRNKLFILINCDGRVRSHSRGLLICGMLTVGGLILSWLINQSVRD